jgi:hypothetical protein
MTLSGTDPAHSDGQLHTLGLLEQRREECKNLCGASSSFYFRVDKLLRELANPNLHDIPTRPPFRVELWDRPTSTSDRYPRNLPLSKEMAINLQSFGNSDSP